MSSEEDINEEIPEEAVPLEVIVKNVEKKEIGEFDSREAEEYEDISITEEEIEEFENGST